MIYQNFVFYLVIPLVLLSIPSLLENVQAEINSTSQIPLQQNQNMNSTTEALMKVNIFELKDALMEANLAIVDGDFKEALTGVRDIESQLLQVKPMPTKLLDNIHKAINAIAREDTDKALNTLTGIQVTILKTENQIFKAAMADPQMMEQVKAAVANPQMMEQFNTIEPNTNDEEDSKDIEEDSKDSRQQFDTMGTETIINVEEYYK
ncbi:MAG: hypothetical protein ACRD6U_08595 [Nitrososphaeraceae archaeon]